MNTLTDFADSRPCQALTALADELGKEDVAAVQIETILREEARHRGTIDRFIRDLLIRRLHQRIPDGWGVSDHYDFEFRRASAYASWIVAVPEEHQALAEKAWQALRSTDIPTGWLPSGVDDAILDRAFASVSC